MKNPSKLWFGLAALLAAAAAPPLLADEVNMTVAAGDGYIVLGDGRPVYMFSFSDVTAVESDQDKFLAGLLAASAPAPTIVLDEGDEFFLRLINVGLVVRPDLEDPHSIHWHGFPNAATIFDGVPESSISIGMGGSVTYYYNVVEPGTYFWHCHVEATEHIQMGMIGNLYVRPAQNNLPGGTNLSGFTHQTGYKYAYNDGDGSTYYDVEVPLQITAFDADFHDASETVQPLPFALMTPDYAMFNGRGYPDTVNPDPLDAPAENGGKVSQRVSAFIEANQGQKILLRMSSVSLTRLYTVTTVGLTMRVVGQDAKLLRGPTGKNLSYQTSTVTLGGGEARDVIIDTTGVAPGTYAIYTSNLNYLSNGDEDFGGLMTEVVIH